MLEDKDIQRLMEVLATKEDVADIRDDVHRLGKAVQSLTISVDKLVEGIDALRGEYSATRSQINRHERWIEELAEKIGHELKS